MEDVKSVPSSDDEHTESSKKDESPSIGRSSPVRILIDNLDGKRVPKMPRFSILKTETSKARQSQLNMIA